MKEAVLKYFFIIMVFVVSFSCKKYTPDEYLKKILNNKDYVKSFSDSILFIKCIYLPQKVLVINELKKNPERMKRMNEDLLEKDLEQFSNGDYFRIVIGLNSGTNILTYNIADNQDLSRRINYLNTVVSNDWLLYDTDTYESIKPLTVNFYNNFGMSMAIELTVVFPKNPNRKKIKISYNDKLFGINKPVEFSFNYSKIHKDNYKLVFKN